MYKKKKKGLLAYILITELVENRKGQSVAFQMCQDCDKSCLNFYPKWNKVSTETVAQTLWSGQANNQSKKINQMWKVA